MEEFTLSIQTQVTAIPVFIAGTDSTVTETIRIDSYTQFTEDVGSFDSEKTLHVAIRTYFDNGGGCCYILGIENLAVEIAKLDDVTLLVATGQDILTQVPQLCQESPGLFAILDGPVGELTAENVAALPSIPDAAVYYPWLTASWTNLAIPPSAAAAGAYCTVDRDRGVWKAPANVVLKGGVHPERKVAPDQSITKSINPIVEQTQGTVIWGARTLASGDPLWTYVPVRRFFQAVQRDIQRALRSLIFEANNLGTWQRAKAAVDGYLYKVWTAGGLQGGTNQEAYYVQVGKDVTMSDEDVAEGRLVVKVGLAIVRPAEFVEVVISQYTAQA